MKSHATHNMEAFWNILLSADKPDCYDNEKMRLNVEKITKFSKAGILAKIR